MVAGIQVTADDHRTTWRKVFDYIQQGIKFTMPMRRICIALQMRGYDGDRPTVGRQFCQQGRAPTDTQLLRVRCPAISYKPVTVVIQPDHRHLVERDRRQDRIAVPTKNMAGWQVTQLNTVRNPLETTVQDILKLLIDRIDNSDRECRTIRVDPQLVLRGTH